MPVSHPSSTRPFLNSPFTEALASISPDGHWVALTSDETGAWEVYVSPFPQSGEKIRISIAGGEEPVWSHDGKQLYYRFGTKWFVVDVTPGGVFKGSRPRLLFQGDFTNIPGYSYDVAPDGRFLVVEGVEETRSVTQLTVVTNIFDEIKRKFSPRQ